MHSINDRLALTPSQRKVIAMTIAHYYPQVINSLALTEGLLLTLEPDGTLPSLDDMDKIIKEASIIRRDLDRDRAAMLRRLHHILAD